MVKTYTEFGISGYNPSWIALTPKQVVPINDFYTSIAMAPIFCGLGVKFGKDNTERHTRGSILSDGMWSKRGKP